MSTAARRRGMTKSERLRDSRNAAHTVSTFGGKKPQNPPKGQRPNWVLVV